MRLALPASRQTRANHRALSPQTCLPPDARICRSLGIKLNCGSCARAARAFCQARLQRARHQLRSWRQTTRHQRSGPLCAAQSHQSEDCCSADRCRLYPLVLANNVVRERERSRPEVVTLLQPFRKHVLARLSNPREVTAAQRTRLGDVSKSKHVFNHGNRHRHIHCLGSQLGSPTQREPRHPFTTLGTNWTIRLNVCLARF